MRLALIACLLTTLSAAAAAQPTPGNIYSVTSSGHLCRITANGITSILATTTAPSEGITTSADLRGILFAGYGSTISSIGGTINEWRNNTVTTIFSSSRYSIEELLVNQNGEIMFTGRDNRTFQSGLFRLDGGNTTTSITTTANLGSSSIFMNGGLLENVDTGNYTLTTGAFIGSQVFDVSDDGVVTSLITSTYISGAYSLAQDRRNGHIYKSSFNNTYQFITNGTSTTLTPTGGTIPLYQALATERASAPDNARLLYSVFQSPTTVNSFVHRIQDPSGTPVVISSTPLSRPSPGGTRGALLAGARNVGSRKNGPGAYTLYFNFAGEGGANYVAAVGASGYTPGFSAGGLNVCLNVDTLVVASIQNLLRPFFDPGPGILDPSGFATGSIALGQDNLGVLIHIVALTVQGGAIRTVSSPHVMRL